jgi:probable rRNA maturation factor
MLDVEVFGWALATDAPSPEEVRRLCAASAASAAIHDGHVAIEFVDEERIAQLNRSHRGRSEPTDVLSFPIDGAQPLAPGGPPGAPPGGNGGRGEPEMRELGDVVICPAHTTDLREAIVHGMLHLLGMDHEADDGQMLALQRELLRQEGR